MNTAIAITPITAPNHVPIRDAMLRRGVADFETSAGDAENSDSTEAPLSVEISHAITIGPFRRVAKRQCTL